MIEGTVKSTAHHDAIHELPKLTALVDGKRRIVEHPPTLIKLPEHDPAMLADVGAARLSRDAPGGPACPPRALSAGRLRAQGRGRRQRRARSLRRPVHRRLGRRSAVPPGQAGGGVRVRAVSRTQHARAATASGSSPVSVASRRPATSSSAGPSASEVEHAYFRQLQDQKGSAVIDTMTLEDLATWGELCAWALARGHARSGDPAMIAGYLGTDDAFDHAMATFAEAYADQNERDHAALLAAIKSGRISAVQGV